MGFATILNIYILSFGILGILTSNKTFVSRINLLMGFYILTKRLDIVSTFLSLNCRSSPPSPSPPNSWNIKSSVAWPHPIYI